MAENRINKGRKGIKEQVLAELEARCVEIGIKLVYDDLRGEGGLCRVRDQFWVIVNRRVSVVTKIRILNEVLKKVGGNAAVSSLSSTLPDTSIQSVPGTPDKSRSAGL